jgi:hypothetical protein
VQCSFSREVWFRCGQQLGINFIVPDTTDNLKDWWIAERERFRKKEKGWFAWWATPSGKTEMRGSSVTRGFIT